MFGHQIEFLKQYRERFETTGAILPSGRSLARSMSGPMRAHAGAKRVLEVGPGTGAVTAELVKHIKPGDRFDLVEINDKFAEIIRERFRNEEGFRKVAAQSEVHCCPLQEFRPEGPYDYIISGLPFNNFRVELVEELIDRCLEMLRPGGVFSLFEYMYLRSIRRRVGRRTVRDRLNGIDRVLKARFVRHRFKRDWIFVNAPPAWVQHLRRTEG